MRRWPVTRPAANAAAPPTVSAVSRTARSGSKPTKMSRSRSAVTEPVATISAMTTPPVRMEAMLSSAARRPRCVVVSVVFIEG